MAATDLDVQVPEHPVDNVSGRGWQQGGSRQAGRRSHHSDDSRSGEGHGLVS
jgi:hypothetical protein